MKTRYLFLLLALCFNTSRADFSNTNMWFHPLYINNEPFILDFRGEWPSDCHPGEQKPVISEYTGDSVLIEFEIILEHVVCNATPTPYRVLVDMSDVVDDVPGDFPFIDVTLRFGGAELVKRLDKICLLRCDPPPPPRAAAASTGHQTRSWYISQRWIGKTGFTAGPAESEDGRLSADLRSIRQQ